MLTSNNDFETNITLIGGHPCATLPPLIQTWCQNAASNGKCVCLINRNKSTGPKTDAGRKRCAAAKFIHGRESREQRRVRAEKLREIRSLERVLKLKGLLV
jgi:hypothetical protein